MRSMPLRHIFASILCVGLVDSGAVCQSTPASSKELPGSAAQKIIIDTDIGGDIDDAFAVALALQSPEFEILGMASTSGDTTLRARLLSRLLQESGRGDITVAVGVARNPKPGAGLSQAPYADGGPTGQSYIGAVEFLLKQIRRHPGEIT